MDRGFRKIVQHSWWLKLALELAAALVIYLHLHLLSLPWQASSPVQDTHPNSLSLVKQAGPRAHGGSCGQLWDVPTLYINLEREATRRAEILQDLEKLKSIASFQRLNATDVLEPETGEVASQVSSFLSRTETAVLLSHLRAIEQGMQSFPQSQYVLIIEDDVSFATVGRWAGTLRDLLDEATKEFPDWEILNIACSNWRDSRAFQAGFFFQRYRFQSFNAFKGPEFFGAVAYAVRRSSGVHALVDTFHRWKEAAKRNKVRKATNRTEEENLRNVLFQEPSDWMLYRKLQSYVTTMPLLVPNNTELSSLVHDEKTVAHLEQAALSLSFWATQPVVCTDIDSSNLAHAFINHDRDG